MDLNLILKDIKDTWVRENFHRIQNFLQSQTVLTPEFKFYQTTITDSSEKFAIAHGLAFIPIDIIILSVVGNHNFYFRYQDFDRTNIYVSATGPVTLRFLAGRFPNQATRQATQKPLPLVGPAAPAPAAGDTTDSGTTWFTGTAVPVNTTGVEGDFFLNISNYHVFLKKSGAWADLGALGAPGPAGSAANLFAEVIELNAAQIAAKCLYTQYAPGNALGVLLDVVGGTGARLNYDYTVSGRKISWAGMGLEVVLEVGDVLRVSYTV